MSVQFDFVLSTCYSPVFPGVSALPYLALFGFIKHCHLSLLLISVFLVHPCFVHQDRRPDLNSKRRPLFHHIFIFFIFESLLSCSCLSVSPRHGSCRSLSHHSPLNSALEFGGIAASPLDLSPSVAHPSPPFAGDRRCRPRLTQAPLFLSCKLVLIAINLHWLKNATAFMFCDRIASVIHFLSS